MNPVIEYFSSLEAKPLHRLAFLTLPILILWFVENGFPLVRMHYKKSKAYHAAINFGLTLCHLVVHAALATWLVLVSDWCQANQFGLIHWFAMPVWAIVLTAVLGLDFFGGWLVHILEHKVPLLWRIHVVHHADNNVDVTTGLRHHPFEAINRWIFFTAGAFLLGLPVYAIMISQTLNSMFTMFTHANIALPQWLDKAISYIFISPNMHKVHHHWKQPYTDSNYGTTFSIWDRLLGTYTFLEPENLRYGLDRYYNNSDDEKLGELIKSPFTIDRNNLQQ